MKLLNERLIILNIVPPGTVITPPGNNDYCNKRNSSSNNYDKIIR